MADTPPAEPDKPAEPGDAVGSAPAAPTTIDRLDSAPLTEVAPLGVPATLISLSGILGRLMVVGLAIFIILWMIFQIGPIAIAMFLAAFLTALALPLANLLHKIMPKILAVILALLLIVAACIFVLYNVVASIVAESSALKDAVNAGIQTINDWLQNGPLGLTGDQLAAVDKDAEGWLQTLGQNLLGVAAQEASALGTIVTAGAVFFFATLFFMMSGAQIWAWFVSWMPKRAQEVVDTAGVLGWRTLSGYARGMVIVALADAILVYIGLMIMGVPLAPALAAVVFMGAFIPVIGAPIATLLAAVVALATKGLPIALAVVGLTIVVGSFDGDVLQPLVMGKAVSLHPLAIVSVIAAGAIAFGIVGALIGVPIASAIYAIAKYLTNRDPEHPFPPTSSDPPTPAVAA